MTLNIKTSRDGIQFSAFIQPRSSKNKICGLQGQSLKIRLTSPPVDGAANKTCIKLLAKVLNISQSQINIISGEKGRNKVIRINEVNRSEFLNKISQLNEVNY